MLRPWRDEDIAAVGEMSADPAVMEYLVPLAERGLSVETWVAGKRAHWDEHGFGQWVVEITGEASFIGVIGLETVSYRAHFTPRGGGRLAARTALLGSRLRDRGGQSRDRLRLR